MRIGFILETFYIPAWLYDAVEKVMSIKEMAPCVLILNNTKNTLQEAADNEQSNSFVFNYYAQWDKNRYKKQQLDQSNNAYALKDIRHLMPLVPHIELSLVQEENPALEVFKPEVLFQMGCHALSDSLCKLPIHGIWYFHHDTIKKNQMDYLGFWELYHGRGCIVGSLVRVTSTTNDTQTLAQTTIPTAEEQSMTKTRNALAWDSSPLLALCLKQLIKTGSPILYKKAQLFDEVCQNRPPDSSDATYMFLKLIFRKIKNPRNCISQHWTIQLSLKHNEPKTAKLDKKKFKTLTQPKGTFWADPFLIQIDNKDYLFFEEFDYQKQRGIIKVAQILEHGELGESHLVLENQFHFSNPYVFIEDGIIYLLPEQAESGEIALYQCINFPGQWKKVATILKGGYYVDPILLKKDNKWWLFFVEKMSSQGIPSVYGKLWFSESLLGPWQEHPMSPISTDCRYSRNAGAIIGHDNQFIRVVQDCSHEYGRQVHLLKIKQLSETVYKDELIGSIAPEEFGVEGIHTVNSSGQLTVIDSRKKTPKHLIFSSTPGHRSKQSGGSSAMVRFIYGLILLCQ